MIGRLKMTDGSDETDEPYGVRGRCNTCGQYCIVFDVPLFEIGYCNSCHSTITKNDIGSWKRI